jgi:hypothetical protein
MLQQNEKISIKINPKLKIKLNQLQKKYNINNISDTLDFYILKKKNKIKKLKNDERINDVLYFPIEIENEELKKKVENQDHIIKGQLEKEKILTESVKKKYLNFDDISNLTKNNEQIKKLFDNEIKEEDLEKFFSNNKENFILDFIDFKYVALNPLISTMKDKFYSKLLTKNLFCIIMNFFSRININFINFLFMFLKINKNIFYFLIKKINDKKIRFKNCFENSAAKIIYAKDSCNFPDADYEKFRDILSLNLYSLSQIKRDRKKINEILAQEVELKIENNSISINIEKVIQIYLKAVLKYVNKFNDTLEGIDTNKFEIISKKIVLPKKLKLKETMDGFTVDKIALIAGGLYFLNLFNIKGIDDIILTNIIIGRETKENVKFENFKNIINFNLNINNFNFENIKIDDVILVTDLKINDLLIFKFDKNSFCNYCHNLRKLKNDLNIIFPKKIVMFGKKIKKNIF